MSFPIVPSNADGDKYQSFRFGDRDIRIVMREGEPWFVLVDVCTALGLSNPSKAVDRLYDDEKDGITFSDTAGRPNRLLIISESGLYKLIARSNKPIARQFQDWMFGEIMPAIRKTGTYTNPNHPAIQNPQVPALPAQLEHTLERIFDKLASVEAKVSARAGSDYFTVVAYFKYKGYPAPTHSEAQSVGQLATKLSQRKGVKIAEGFDYYNNPVNQYREDIIDTVLRKNRPDLFTLGLALPEGEE